MSEKRDKVSDILSEMGVSSDIIKKSYEREEKSSFKKSYKGEKFTGDFDENEQTSNSVKFIKHKSFSKKMTTNSLMVLMIFALSMYLQLGNIYNFPLPELFVFYINPYIFTLLNIALLIFSSIISLDVFYDGFNHFPKANLNTLVCFITFSSLLYMLSVIFLPRPVGYFPLTIVCIFLHFLSLKNLSYKHKNHAFLHKILASQGDIKYVTNSQKGNGGYILKSDEQNFIKSKSYDVFISIYVYVCVFMSILFSLFTANGDFSLAFYILSVILPITLPLNFIFCMPYRKIAKLLFRDGIAIKNFSDLRIFVKNEAVCLSDTDIFDENSVFIDTISLFSSYSAEQVIAICDAGFKAQNSASHYAFESEMKKMYIAPLKADEISDETADGFTFSLQNTRISIGNESYIQSLGLNCPISVENSMYVVANHQIVANITLKFVALNEIYDLLGILEKESIEIIIASVDFNINDKMICDLFDLKQIKYLDFSKRYSLKHQKISNEQPIMLKKYSGKSFILSVLYSRKINTLFKRNLIIGVINLAVGISLLGYLCVAFSPHILLPHNILAYMLLWLMPTLFMQFAFSKI